MTDRILRLLTRRTFILALLMFVMLIGSAAAQTRIGVVDMQEVTERSTTIQAMISDAEGPLMEQRRQIEQRAREFEQQRSQFESRRSVMSTDEIEKEADRLRAIRQEIEDLEYEVSKQYARLEDEVMRPAIERIIATIGSIAQAEGYDLVLPNEVALYASERVDLTPLVIQALDR